MKHEGIWPWVRQLVGRYRGQLLLIGGVALLESAVSAAIPLAWQQLIDRATAGTADYALALAFLGLLVLDVTPLLGTLRERLVIRYQFDSWGQLLAHLLRLSVPFFKGRDSTVLIEEVSKGAAAGGSLLQGILNGNLLADIPVGVFALVFVASHDGLAAAILVAFLVVFLLLCGVVGKRLAAVQTVLQEMENVVTARQREVIAQVEAVKLHRAETAEREWYHTQGQTLVALELRLNWLYRLFDVLSGLAGVLPFMVALVVFLPQVVQGTMTVGMLLALQLYSARAVSPVGYLGRIYQEIKRNLVTMQPVLRLLRESPTVVEAVPPTEMQPLRHEIALRQVTFQYPDPKDDRPALRDVTLTIPAGKKMAIVGPNGSGKSTLARLLVRFYDPDHGIITYDGTDLRQLSFDTLYQQIAYVTQEVPIFSGTIGENVGYGLPGCPEERMLEACRTAAADFIFRRPGGFRAHVGELGGKLSGGERQRLALARVFLRQPSLIILDEATAALDGLAQREIHAAFDRLLALNSGTTCVVIAHRMSTVRNADGIVVLRDGAVVATGTHDELALSCELYRQLCQEMAT